MKIETYLKRQAGENPTAFNAKGLKAFDCLDTLSSAANRIGKDQNLNELHIRAEVADDGTSFEMFISGKLDPLA